MPDDDAITRARADVEDAESRLFAAEAVAAAEARGAGVWYEPLDSECSEYVVARDGTVIGKMWPPAPGRVLGGWSAQPSGSSDCLGPFNTARAAAVGLAQACEANVE